MKVIMDIKFYLRILHKVIQYTQNHTDCFFFLYDNDPKHFIRSVIID